MLSPDVKKGWLGELQTEHEELEAQFETVKEQRKVLEERIGVLKYAARWFAEAEKPSLRQEAIRRLETMNERLKDAKGAEKEKGIRSVFVLQLIKYVEKNE